MADLDFQPLDFQPEEAPPTKRVSPQGEVATGIDFKPLDFQPAQEQGGKVEKELKTRAWTDRPALVPQQITGDELQEIAQKHGVSSQDLREALPYFGGLPQDARLSDIAKGAVGFAGEAALGVPQKLYKLGQNQQYQNALDDLQDLAQARKSYAQLGAELLTPGVAIGKGAKTLVQAAKAGAATGAIAGAAGARSGQEIQGAAIGAGLGAGLGSAAHGVAQFLESRAAKAATPIEKDVAEGVIRNNQADIEKGTEELLAARRASNEDLEKIIRGQSEMDQPAAQRIVKEQLDQESVQKFMNPATEEGQVIRDRILRTKPDEVQSLGMERAIERELASGQVERKVRDLAEQVSGERPKSLDEATDALKEYASRQGGPAALIDRFRNMQRTQAALETIDNHGIHATKQAGFWGRATNFLSDAQYVLRDIDEKYRVGAEDIHRELNRNYNRSTFARQAFRNKLDDIYKSNKPIDNTIVSTDRIYNALDSGNLAGLTPQEAKAAQEFHNYFDEGLTFVNGLVKQSDKDITPLSIPKRENYVPHMLKDTPELIRSFETKKDAILQKAGVQDFAQIPKPIFNQLVLGDKDTQDLLSGLMLFDAKPIKSSQDLSSRFKERLYSRDGRISIETKARAALEREGVIPDFLKEKNLFKLADRWAGNTLRHLYLRQPVEKLGALSKVLTRAGADVESKYVSNLAQDLMGIRKGTAAESYVQSKVQWQTGIDRLIEKSGGRDTTSGGFLTAVKAIPEMMEALTRQVYPNLLGLSPRAMIMNSTQLMTKTIPELGQEYGNIVALRAGANTAMNFKKQLARVDALGLAPAEFVAAGQRAITDGIRRTALYNIPASAIRGMGEAAMALYTRLDAVNRALTLSMADTMIYDLGRGSKLAERSLLKMPTSVRKSVSNNITTGNTDEATRTLAEYLNASTQYNYNRASMSEWGRTMGPLFSTFSKWPTATVGDIVETFRSRGLLGGAVRNAEKYVAPLALLSGVGYLIHGSKDEMSDRSKKLFGASGLRQAAPIGNLEGIIKGDFFTPPAIDAVIKGFVVPAMEGNEGKLTKGLTESIQNFTPGSVYVRFLTDDLVTLLKGQRPEGSNFLERSYSGAQELTK